MAKKQREKIDLGQKVVAAQETEEDVILNISLRPSKLKDFYRAEGCC